MFKLSALDRFVGAAGKLVVPMEPRIVGLPSFDMKCEGLFVHLNSGIRNPHGLLMEPLTTSIPMVGYVVTSRILFALAFDLGSFRMANYIIYVSTLLLRFLAFL